MGNRKSLYLADETEAIVSPGKHDNFSGRVNSIIIRYAGMINEAMPELTVNEWCAVVDANNSTWLEADGPRGDVAARTVWLNIADSGPDGIDEKWAIDHQALAEKIRTMTYAQQVAIVEIVQRFWAHDHNDTANYAEVFEKIGAKTPPAGKE